MKHSTFLFYLVLIPGASFITFFFRNTVSLFSILFAFLTHLCLGAGSIISASLVTLSISTLIVMIAICMAFFSIAKIHSFFMTFWRIKQLPLILNTHCFSYLTKLKERHAKVKVFNCGDPIAFCYFGTIFLSSGLLRDLNESELEAVFLHEYVHASDYHSVKTWLLELINKSLFVPVFSYIIEDFKLSLEIEADAFVVATQGTNLFLKRALFKAISYPDLNVSQFVSSQLENRIYAIKKPSQVKPRLNIVLLSVIFSMLILFVLFSHHTKMVLAMNESQIHQDASQCSDPILTTPQVPAVKNYSSISR